MSTKQQREEIMSDEERIAIWKAKGERCTYCRGQRLVETITDRLFGCCQQCADRDNSPETVVKTKLPCLCCGRELDIITDDNFTVNSVDHHGFDNGMATTISAGYGSRLDGNVYLIGICDDCVKSKESAGRLMFVYNYMPFGDEPKQC